MTMHIRVLVINVYSFNGEITQLLQLILYDLVCDTENPKFSAFHFASCLQMDYTTIIYHPIYIKKLSSYTGYAICLRRLSITTPLKIC